MTEYFMYECVIAADASRKEFCSFMIFGEQAGSDWQSFLEKLPPCNNRRVILIFSDPHKTEEEKKKLINCGYRLSNERIRSILEN